ncbi:hypothetical protein JHY03_72350 (plasmid) [Streptomyces sp. CA-256286]|nr:hypothetical protein JHY03_72350 [Streptomyces sp. CA-256286]
MEGPGPPGRGARPARCGRAVTFPAMGGGVVRRCAHHRHRTGCAVRCRVRTDFCEGGSVPVAGGAEIATKVCDLVSHAAEAGYAYAVATRDHHIDPGDYFSDTPNFRTSWPVHCVAGTPGSGWPLRYVLRGPQGRPCVRTGHHAVLPWVVGSRTPPLRLLCLCPLAGVKQEGTGGMGGCGRKSGRAQPVARRPGPPRPCRVSAAVPSGEGGWRGRSRAGRGEDVRGGSRPPAHDTADGIPRPISRSPGQEPPTWYSWPQKPYLNRSWNVQVEQSSWPGDLPTVRA